MLEIRDLRISFGARQLVHIEELTLNAGHIVGLVGESGSGKSLTASAILGLAGRVGATVTGSVRLNDTELLGLPESAMRRIRGRRICMIHQSPSLAFNPVMKTGTIFTRALQLHGDYSRAAARARAAAAVGELVLPSGVLDSYPLRLSGGQLQRVAIAMALALDSEVLLADEPTSALDVTVQAELLVLLRRAVETHHLAVLLISHDLAVVSEIADTIAVMERGRLVETGETARIVSSPQIPYTKELVAAAASLSA